MVYGSMWVHMGQYGPKWRPGSEKNDLGNVKQIISERDFFQGLNRGDPGHQSKVRPIASADQNSR